MPLTHRLLIEVQQTAHNVPLLPALAKANRSIVPLAGLHGREGGRKGGREGGREEGREEGRGREGGR